MKIEQKFGILASTIFYIISFLAFKKEILIDVCWLLLIIGVALSFVTLFKPSWLAVPCRLWLHLGVLIGKLVTPFILLTLFYFIFTPIAVVFRLFGRDELRLKVNKCDSFWITRASAEPARESFNNLF